MDHGGEIRDHFKANTDASHNKRASLAPLNLHVNSDHGNEGRVGSETVLNDVNSGIDSARISEYADRASTSSWSSSSDDFFQVIPHKLSPIPRPNGGTSPLYEKDKVDVSNEPFYMLEESNNESPSSDITHESLVSHTSPTQLPPLQVMERPLGFDPGWIPTSIFSKPLSPTQWSVASSESLFSIRIGNNSLRGASRKIKDFYRSGELPNSDEILIYNQIFQSEEPHKPGNPTRTDEFIGRGQSSLVAEEVQPYKHIDMTKNLNEAVKPKANGVVDASVNNFLVASINQDAINIREHKDFISAAQSQDGKETSPQSVTFPTNKKSACSSCHCSSCSHIFRSCKWFNLQSCCNNTLSCPSSICKGSSWQWRPSCRSCHWNSRWPSCHFTCSMFKCLRWPSF